ncbi:MAG: DUF1320 domain-containing protein [Thermodesulfobacteriota bacterium]
MAYSTQADLLEQLSETELIQLTDDAGAGVVDASVVERAIADADLEIDSYCAARYGVPFATTPGIIRKLSVDIALYNLFSRRTAAAPRVMPEDRQARYDNAIRFLRDLAKGLISIGAGAPAPMDEGLPQATTRKSDRIFTTGRASDGSTGSLDNY